MCGVAVEKGGFFFKVRRGLGYKKKFGAEIEWTGKGGNPNRLHDQFLVGQ